MSNEPIPCIPLEKGYVSGYYEKRNGKLVWISPYENSRTRNDQPGNSDVDTLDGGSVRKPRAPFASSGKNPEKTLDVAQQQNTSLDYVLDAIIGMIKTISNMESGEIVRLQAALKTCRSIVRELGYLDDTISSFFRVPNVKPSRLGKRAARETAAMAKECDKLARRVTKHSLHVRIQKLGEQFEAAL